MAARVLPRVSLVVNVLVLVPVVAGVLTEAEWTRDAYGGAGTPARGIMLALYMALLVASAALLAARDVVPPLPRCPPSSLLPSTASWPPPAP